MASEVCCTHSTLCKYKKAPGAFYNYLRLQSNQRTLKLEGSLDQFSVCLAQRARPTCGSLGEDAEDPGAQL